MKSFIGLLILFAGGLISSLIYDNNHVLAIVIFVVTIVLWLLLMIFMKNKKKGISEIIVEDASDKDNEVTNVVDEKDEKRYTDKELEMYELDDLQKKAVNKGEFEPYNFEEDDLEEDDYYYEDDDNDDE